MNRQTMVVFSSACVIIGLIFTLTKEIDNKYSLREIKAILGSNGENDVHKDLESLRKHRYWGS